MPMMPSPRATGNVRHLVATKSFVLSSIEAYGAKSVLVGWEGTDEEAKAQVRSDPRDVFASCSCKQDAQGYCLGTEVSE
jgi:hypothetical protein